MSMLANAAKSGVLTHRRLSDRGVVLKLTCVNLATGRVNRHSATMCGFDR